MAQQYRMETGSLSDADRARHRWINRTRDQDFDGARATGSQIRANVDRSAFDRREVSFVPIRPRRCIDGILWCSFSREATTRSGLLANPDPHRFFPPIPRRALSLGCRLRSGARSTLRASGLAFLSAENGESGI